MSLPLSGVLVLDLTRAVAGPFCTMMLADLGARVIKVEEPGAGDETRRWGPPFAGEDSTYFLGLNRNKESAALDLKSERGREIARNVARRADVVVENFRPGVAARLGLGYDEIARANPGVVYASISGFGQDGPDRERPGYDLIVQALSGLMYVSSSPEGPPVKTAFAVADILAGCFASQAILAALYGRERTGEGRRIEVTLLESLLAGMSSLASGYLMAGRDPAPNGTAQPNIAPYQMFACADRPIVAGVPNERIWRRFCEALERPEWLEDERFADNAARNTHREPLVQEIEAALRTRRAQHWLERLAAHEIPCAPVLRVGEALELPAVAARGSIGTMTHPGREPLRVLRNPMRMSGVEMPAVGPPRVGEHTEQIVAEFSDGGLKSAAG